MQFAVNLMGKNILSCEEICQILEENLFSSSDINYFKDTYECYESIKDRTDKYEEIWDDSCNFFLRMGLPKEKIDNAKLFYSARVGRNEKLEDRTLKQQKREEWYDGPRNGDCYWPPFISSIESKNWDKQDVESLKEGSNRVISLLHNPASLKFQTKGLVIGYVQSGKTANMTAVISKAADRNFRLFIVLSGLTNSLRNQTQERLTKDLISLKPDNWHTWTTDNNDLKSQALLNPNVILADPGKKHLAVVKKNSVILKRLIDTVKNINGPLINKISVLIIDDEADQASVNSSGVRREASKINKQINILINSFKKIAFIGYTATPYANILIDRSANNIYPRDFITALNKPSRYFGAERLFGRDLLESVDGEVPDDGLDMIRIIPEKDCEELNSTSNRTAFKFSLTKTLKDSINYFFLAMAVRYARNDKESHMTMMVHTTAFADIQNSALPVIDHFRKDCLKLHRANDPAYKRELKVLWNSEKNKVPPKDCSNEKLEVFEFDSLWPLLDQCIEETEVKAENYKSDDRIDFGLKGRKYIVIGGNVLARGLTIEGLMVSYFLRHASTYDALMQMGRWFGFRHNYEDLPRVWLSEEMRNNFKDLATVEQEIRNDINTMVEFRETPMKFAIRIRTHPSLAITSRNKMLNAKTEYCSFSNTHRQTFKFKNSLVWLRENWNAAENLVNKINKLGCRSKSRYNCYTYLDIPVDLILDFLNAYNFHSHHADLANGNLANYINRKIEKKNPEILEWSVTVVSNSSKNSKAVRIGHLPSVKLSNRSRYGKQVGDTFDIKTLVSSRDYTTDLPTDFSETSWDKITKFRRNEYNRGMLLLYPIDKDSIPQKKSACRYSLNACEHVMGVGIMFPNIVADENEAKSYVYANDPLPNECEDIDYEPSE